MAEDDWEIPSTWNYVTSDWQTPAPPDFTHEDIYRDETGGIWFVRMNIKTGVVTPRPGSRFDRRRFKSISSPQLEKSK
jgi:hypothetical protein